MSETLQKDPLGNPIREDAQGLIDLLDRGISIAGAMRDGETAEQWQARVRDAAVLAHTMLNPYSKAFHDLEAVVNVAFVRGVMVSITPAADNSNRGVLTYLPLTGKGADSGETEQIKTPIATTPEGRRLIKDLRAIPEGNMIRFRKRMEEIRSGQHAGRGSRVVVGVEDLGPYTR